MNTFKLPLWCFLFIAITSMAFAPAFAPAFAYVSKSPDAKNYRKASREKYMAAFKDVEAISRDDFSKITNLEYLSHAAVDSRRDKSISAYVYEKQVLKRIPETTRLNPEKAYNFLRYFSMYNFEFDIAILKALKENNNQAFLNKIKQSCSDNAFIILYIDYLETDSPKPLLDILEKARKSKSLYRAFANEARNNIRQFASSEKNARILLEMSRSRHYEIKQDLSFDIFSNLTDAAYLDKIAKSGISFYSGDASRRLDDIRRKEARKKEEQARRQAKAEQLKKEKELKAKKHQEYKALQAEAQKKKHDVNTAVATARSESKNKQMSKWFYVAGIIAGILLCVKLISRFIPKKSAPDKETGTSSLPQPDHHLQHVRKIAIRAGAATECTRAAEQCRAVDNAIYSAASQILNSLADKLSRARDEDIALMHEAQAMASSENLLPLMRKRASEELGVMIEALRTKGVGDEIDLEEVIDVAYRSINA